MFVGGKNPENGHRKKIIKTNLLSKQKKWTTYLVGIIFLMCAQKITKMIGEFFVTLAIWKL